jgi:hypothetical protein
MQSGNVFPTGQVQFVADQGTAQQTVIGSGNLSGGVATTSYSNLSVGSHTVTATYTGDTNFNGSTGTLSQTVNTAASTTTVTSSENPSNYGDSVTFTATVTGSSGTPTGTVQFAVDNTNLGSVTLSGGVATTATSSISAGKHTVTATYTPTAGSNTYAASSGSLTQTVNKAASSMALSSSLNPSDYGESVQFLASVTGPGGYPTGTVQFTADGTTNLGSSSLAVVRQVGKTFNTAAVSSSSLWAGNHTITASYPGDDNFLGSSGTLSGGQIVMAQTTTSVSSSENPAYQGDTVTLTATVTDSTGTDRASPMGTVTFAVSGDTKTYTATLSTNRDTGATTASIQYKFTAGGNYTITASYGGSPQTNYLASSGTLSLIVISSPK